MGSGCGGWSVGTKKRCFHLICSLIRPSVLSSAGEANLVALPQHGLEYFFWIGDCGADTDGSEHRAEPPGWNLDPHNSFSIVRGYPKNAQLGVSVRFQSVPQRYDCSTDDVDPLGVNNGDPLIGALFHQLRTEFGETGTYSAFKSPSET